MEEFSIDGTIDFKTIINGKNTFYGKVMDPVGIGKVFEDIVLLMHEAYSVKEFDKHNTLVFVSPPIFKRLLKDLGFSGIPVKVLNKCVDEWSPKSVQFIEVEEKNIHENFIVIMDKSSYLMYKGDSISEDKSIAVGVLKSVKDEAVHCGEFDSYSEFLKVVVQHMNDSNNKEFTIERFYASDDILIQKLLADRVAQIYSESPINIFIGNKPLFKMKSSSQLCFLEMHMKSGSIYSCILRI